MRLADLQLILTNHAYEQYTTRVGQTDRSDLTQELAEEIRSGFYRREREFVQISGIWWVYVIDDNQVKLVTCYGRSQFNLAAGVRWARAHKDRILLEGRG